MTKLRAIAAAALGAGLILAGCGNGAAPAAPAVAVRTPVVEKHADLPARMIHFSNDFSVGTLGVRPASFVGAWGAGWAKKGDARGDIEVQPATQAMLTGTKSAKTLGGLETLAPGDIQCLDLISDNLTDEGLAGIEKLTGLLYLGLPHGSTDATLARLKPLAELTDLRIEGPGVTDAGLESLKALPKLKRLFHRSTSLTPQGIEKFQKEMPELRIVQSREEVKMESLKLDQMQLPPGMKLPGGGGGGAAGGAGAAGMFGKKPGEAQKK